MSETNGTAPEVKRVLSLETARATKTRKGNDFITVQQAHDMVIQECAKVHEHYLTQIPTFVARMVQDALLSYGLIVPQPGVDIAPVVAPESPETPSGDTSTADSIEWPDSVRAALNEPIPEIVAIRDSTEPVFGSVHVVAHDFPVGRGA